MFYSTNLIKLSMTDNFIVSLHCPRMSDVIYPPTDTVDKLNYRNSWSILWDKGIYALC